MLRNRMKTILGIVGAALALPAFASEVVQEDVTTFTAGTNISASEMNANFDALISAIDDNAARIAALEEPDASAIELGGRGYTVTEVTAGAFSNDEGFDQSRLVRRVGSLFFNPGNSGGSFTPATTTAEGVDNGQDFLDPTITIDDGFSIQTFSYAVSGQTITVTPVGGTAMTFTLSPDGMMIVGSNEVSLIDPAAFDWTLAIGVYDPDYSPPF